MSTETITWHVLPAGGLPDADLTVLVEYVTEDGERDTWPAWWSGTHWMDASTGDLLERDGRARVVAWCDMPVGSGAC